MSRRVTASGSGRSDVDSPRVVAGVVADLRPKRRDTVIELIERRLRENVGRKLHDRRVRAATGNKMAPVVVTSSSSDHDAMPTIAASPSRLPVGPSASALHAPEAEMRCRRNSSYQSVASLNSPFPPPLSMCSRTGSGLVDFRLRPSRSWVNINVDVGRSARTASDIDLSSSPTGTNPDFNHYSAFQRAMSSSELRDVTPTRVDVIRRTDEIDVTRSSDSLDGVFTIPNYAKPPSGADRINKKYQLAGSQPPPDVIFHAYSHSWPISQQASSYPPEPETVVCDRPSVAADAFRMTSQTGSGCSFEYVRSVDSGVYSRSETLDSGTVSTTDSVGDNTSAAAASELSPANELQLNDLLRDMKLADECHTTPSTTTTETNASNSIQRFPVPVGRPQCTATFTLHSLASSDNNFPANRAVAIKLPPNVRYRSLSTPRTASAAESAPARTEDPVTASDSSRPSSGGEVKLSSCRLLEKFANTIAVDCRQGKTTTTTTTTTSATTTHVTSSAALSPARTCSLTEIASCPLHTLPTTSVGVVNDVTSTRRRIHVKRAQQPDDASCSVTSSPANGNDDVRANCRQPEIDTYSSASTSTARSDVSHVTRSLPKSTTDNASSTEIKVDCKANRIHKQPEKAVIPDQKVEDKIDRRGKVGSMISVPNGDGCRPVLSPTACVQGKTRDPEMAGNGRQLQIQEVLLDKGPLGLGFCVDGGTDSPSGPAPITVKRLFKGETAAKGKLQAGDEIVKVNDRSLHDMTHLDAWALLKKLPDGLVRMTIRRKENI